MNRRLTAQTKTCFILVLFALLGFPELALSFSPPPPPETAPPPAPTMIPRPIRIDGEACPSGYHHLTYASATENQSAACSNLSTWDIARLDGRGSMSGSGYGCGLIQNDTRNLGHSLCVPDTLKATGEKCPTGYYPMTREEASANLGASCGLLSTWDIARLSHTGSLSGGGYGCGLINNDTRSLGHAVCIGAPVRAKQAVFTMVTPVGDEYQSALRSDLGANIIEGDFNGDGLSDFIRQEKGGWDDDIYNSFNVYFSRGDGYFDIVTPPGNEYQSNLRHDPGVNIIAGDFNGDGMTDFIRQEKGGWDDDIYVSFQVYFSYGDGYFNIVTPVGNEYQSNLRNDPGANIIAGDFNGDGKTDFIRQEKGGWDDDTYLSFQVYFSRGDGYFDIVTPAGDEYQSELRFDPGANILTGDFNGDGKADFIRQERAGWDDDVNNSFNVYFSRGDGYFNKVTPYGDNNNSGQDDYQAELRADPGVNLIAGDFDGDGKTDFIRQEKNAWDDDAANSMNIYYSRGDGQFRIVTPVADSDHNNQDDYQYALRFDPGVNLISGDFNGDGKSDFIRQERGGLDDDSVNTFSIYFSGTLIVDNDLDNDGIANNDEPFACRANANPACQRYALQFATLSSQIPAPALVEYGHLSIYDYIEQSIAFGDEFCAALLDDIHAFASNKTLWVPSDFQFICTDADSDGDGILDSIDPLLRSETLECRP